MLNNIKYIFKYSNNYKFNNFKSFKSINRINIPINNQCIIHRPFHSIIPDKYTLKSIYLYISRQKILLRGEMVKSRSIEIKLPYNMLNYTFKFTLSNLAGHTSFIFLAISYLENDFYYLRIYALSGITLSIIFQYYRPIPLWIPIRWNSLFFLINIIMVILLIKEESEAMNIPPEQQELYRNVFLAHGSMKPVDFLHLMSLAERKTIHKGEKLVIQGSFHHSIHLVQSGSLSVEHDSNIVGKINKNQFVGAMSYLTWEESVDDHSLEDHTHKYWNVFEHIPLALSSTTTHSSNESSGQRGHADVICEDECIVYTWSFQELHELLELQPNIGFVFEKSVSADLNKKMTVTWKAEPKIRYKEILTAILIDGDVTEMKKKFLTEFRNSHNITINEHEALLKELDWTVMDFDNGFKSGSTKLVIQEYEKLLSSYVNKQTKISESTKIKLRDFRQKNKLSAEVHLKLLTKYGWSLDEYESGVKIIPQDLKADSIHSSRVYSIFNNSFQYLFRNSNENVISTNSSNNSLNK